jgi:pectate lyase
MAKAIMRTLATLYAVLMTLSAWAQGNDTLPAFPGAEGFGAHVTGGRGGRVVKVTNLNASGPGSLQAACSTEGPQIVVFEVSGTIHGDIEIAHGNLTVAGESAPGGGITLNGQFWAAYDDQIQNIIVRFLRIRPNSLYGNQGDAIQFSKTRNFIFDHLTVSWGSDETIDVYSAQDFTIQWCTIEASATHAGHSDGAFHNYGLINGPAGARASIHHNLFAHHRRRSPAVANGPADIRNNVVYNFRDGFVHDNPSNNAGFNLVGNTFKRGPSEDSIFPFCFNNEDETLIRYYLSDNYLDDPPLIQRVVENPWDERLIHEGLDYYMDRGLRSVQEFLMPRVHTHPAREAYYRVLEKAGCLPRDFLTQKTVAEVHTRRGGWGRETIPDLMAGLEPAPAPLDGDGDGMPDAWEVSRGLNPYVADASGDDDGDGYTNIEAYLHECAARLINFEAMDTIVVADLLDGTQGTYSFAYYAIPGIPYDILRSHDLINWVMVEDDALAIGPIEFFTDPTPMAELISPTYYKIILSEN